MSFSNRAAASCRAGSWKSAFNPAWKDAAGLNDLPLSVSIVEDSDKLRGTLARVLNRAEGFKCVSQYANAEDALKELPQAPPDVVLMDINLPGMNGVECVRQLKQILPQTQVMMLTVYEDTENIFNALAAGANGYMLKRTSTKELLEAIQEVHRGGSPMTMHIARKVVQSFQKTPPAQPAENLSDREQQVLDLLSQGLMYKEIAMTLPALFTCRHAPASFSYVAK